ncbi:hypothetical protein GCM10023169_17600 [Georgenia halophila]|uniref:SURF1-like protein n=1 Tax=Georgenia halophila TaxID=620889 RepID=A0ABP8L5S2_9MICO
MTSRYDFLRSGRWVGLAAAVLAFAVLCVSLGFWQWGRYEDRLAQFRQVDAAYDADPVPLGEMLDGLEDATVFGDQEWRPVELTGHYVDGSTVLVRNRPVDGTPAMHVVAPFVARTSDGEVLVLVDRGWVPTSDVDSGDVPEAPSGSMTITARLRVAEPPSDREPPRGQVYRIDPDGVLTAVAEITDLGEAAALPVLDGYVTTSTDELGRYGPPESRWGVNLSYAIQWWIFAAGALAALVFLARREAADHAGEEPERGRPSAEEEEDALVDAQMEGTSPKKRDRDRADRMIRRG